ncbi:hypothetical protein LCGC14_0789910 [marine sediment metagenome]|uniref:Uncharacterized protein n=1 Tax=marine sediment metagenome TaxID=412755 RepID=A0A0F9SCW4_9ZZZZ
MIGQWYDGTWYDHVVPSAAFSAATPKEALRKALSAAKPGETILVRDQYFWTGTGNGMAQRMICEEAES